LDYLALTAELEYLLRSAQPSQKTNCRVAFQGLQDNKTVFVTLKNQIAVIDGLNKRKSMNQ